MLCQLLESEAPKFWELIVKIYNRIEPAHLDSRLLKTLGIEKGLATERENFLSLLSAGLERLYIQNNYTTPEKLDQTVEEEFFQRAIGTKRAIGMKRTSFRASFLEDPLLKNFDDLLLSWFSRLGILLLLDIFEEAGKKSLPSPEKLIGGIEKFLNQQK